MSKYRVYFTNTAEYSIEVEAGDPDEAIDIAYDQARFPFIPAGMSGAIGGDWEVDPDDGVEEVEE